MNPPEITQKLENLPATIARLAEVAETARFEYEKKKALYDNDYYKHYLRTKATNPKYTQDQVKAESKTKAYDLWLEVIKAESSFKSCLLRMTEANDTLQAVKVIARMSVTDWQAHMGSVK